MSEYQVNSYFQATTIFIKAYVAPSCMHVKQSAVPFFTQTSGWLLQSLLSQTHNLVANLKYFSIQVHIYGITKKSPQ
jgi:hypothetical protein